MTPKVICCNCVTELYLNEINGCKNGTFTAKCLFNFLLQRGKSIRVEEFADGNVQLIIEFFDYGYSRVVIHSANYVVNSRLCNAANTAQFVNRNIALLVQ